MNVSTLKWTKRGACFVVAALMSFPAWRLCAQEAQPARHSLPAELTKPAAVQIEMSGDRLLRRKIAAPPVSGKKTEDAQSRIAASSFPPLWDTIMFEGFEASFPAANNWAISYANVAPYFWDDVSHNPRTGALSGWCAGATVSPNSVLDPATDNYVNNMNSAMVFGPFSLSSATDAKLDFWYWLDSQVDYDFFIWAASTGPSGPFYGFQTSGNSGGVYKLQSFDLKNVPALGNLLGKPQVYIAFFYQSDFTETHRGAFLDDIFLLKQPSTTTSKADLVPYRVYLRTGPNGAGTEVSTPVLGQQYYVHFDWRNEGPIAANNFRWEIKLNGAVLCANNNQSASPNTSYTSSCQTALIWNCSSGANNLEAVMDVTEIIDETGETNNAVSQSFPCPLPDLVANRIYLRTGPNSGLEVDSPVAGQSYYLHFDWSNTGGSAPDMRLDLKFNNTVICSYNSGFIAANSSTKSWCTTPVIWPAPPSVVFIEGALDVSTAIAEQDENNNVISRSFISAQPNLTTTAFSFSPVAVNAGGAITLSGTVSNNGAFATPSSVKVNFYLSTNPSGPNLNLLLLSTTIAALGAGQSNNFSFTGAVPLNTAQGSYYVWISLDPENTINETNENDNLLFSTTLLTVNAPSLGAEIKPVAASTQTIGASFTVEVAVSNAQNLFGVSFVLNYTNTAFVDVVGTPTAGEFMGNDPIFLPTVDEAGSKVSIGITHKAGQPASTGSGVVTRVNFTSLASTPPGTPVMFSISNIAANDAAGNTIALSPSSLAITLNAAGVIVWPGDTNNDGIVNQADILPIGLHFNKTGPARQNPSSSFTPQVAAPWTPVAATYADANGDGTINQADVLPIGLNFGKTHTAQPLAAEKINPPLTLSKTNAAMIGTTVTGSTNPGQDFEIDVVVNQVNSLFGVSFELLYSPTTLLDPQSADPGSLLGSDVIFFPNIDKNAGRVSIGITRKAGQSGVSGAGAVAKIKLRVSSQAVRGQAITFVLQNVAANDSVGQPIQLSVANGQIILVNVASRQNEPLPAAFGLHANTPNPFNPSTAIQYDLAEPVEVTVKIFDMLGRQVRTLVNQPQAAGRYSIVWDGRDESGRGVTSGTFIYQLRAGGFVQNRKMLLLQ